MPITAKVPSSLRNPDLVRDSADAVRAILDRVPGTPNVGREDRLVRSAIAVSAAGIGGFAMAASGQVSVVSVMFLILGSYLALTALTGRDPMYTRNGIDTRDGGSLADEQAPDEVADGIDRTFTGGPVGAPLRTLAPRVEVPVARSTTPPVVTVTAPVIAEPVVVAADPVVTVTDPVAEPVGASASAA